MRHEGDGFHYAVHADSPGPGRLRLIDLYCYSDAKSALGIGLFPGQSATAVRCHFERGTLGLSSEPVLAHNWAPGDDTTLTFTDCTAVSHTGGPLSVWTDLVTGETSSIPGITAP